jgi:hypothetical protein
MIAIRHIYRNSGAAAMSDKWCRSLRPFPLRAQHRRLPSTRKVCHLTFVCSHWRFFFSSPFRMCLISNANVEQVVEALPLRAKDVRCVDGVAIVGVVIVVNFYVIVSML